MDKIICDVCGTSYPETASQCPICGYARPANSKSVAEGDEAAAGAYTYVKGGRFSSANVRKRNEEKGITPISKDEGSPVSERKSGSNLALGITAVVLLLVLIVVLVFFIFKVLDGLASDPGNSGEVETTQASIGPVSCTELQLENTQVEFQEAGSMWVIHATRVPENTTDEIVYKSSHPEIAEVDENGRITAISGGEAIITLSCGEARAQIAVVCDFETVDDGSWSLNREEFSLLKKGETWDLYSKTSTVSKTKIQWSSDDETVATVEYGIVTAVGKGTTYIHAEYNGTKYSCKVLCKFEDDTNTGDDNTAVDTSTLQLSDKDGDVTLYVNGAENERSFYLYLQDANGNKVDVTWTASKEGIVTIDGNKITAIKSGTTVKVSATYEGKTYECIIRTRTK